MAFIADTVFDTGLNTLDTNGTQIDITTSEINLWANLAAATLGNATVNTGAPANGAVDGRRVTVPAITTGSVTGTGSATHWCLSNGSSTVYAAGPLTASQSVTSGNTFTLDAIDITIRDATAV
jgi:hypothetical protein